MTKRPHHLAAILVAASAYLTLASVAASAQDDPRLVAIKARISRTTPRGREIVKRALNSKLEVFGQPTPQPLSDLIQGRVPSGRSIGWAAYPTRSGPWRIILYYENPYHIRRYFQAEFEYNPGTHKLVVFEPNNSMFVAVFWHSKTYRSEKGRVKIVEEGVPFSIPAMQPTSGLSVLVGKTKYFISYIQHKGATSIEKPVVDRACNYISYSSNTGCGYEGEGMTAFISDIFGSRTVPILSRTHMLRPDQFFDFEGKQYLLIAEENGGTTEGDSFWIYDQHAARFVIHAKGSITRSAPNVFSYYLGDGAYEKDGKPIGAVTPKGLINGSRPLMLLPLTPIHGLTLRRNAKFLANDSNSACYLEQPKHELISAAGTRVLFLAECDTGYAVYYNDKIGLMPKRDLRLIK